MTVLLSKQTRENLKIDTLERGIILSILLLRSAANSGNVPGLYLNSVKVSTNIRQTGESYQASFIGSAKIPYQSNPALLGGMDILENLKPLSTLTVTPNFLELKPTPNAPSLPAEPDRVNTLEKYLLWAAQILAASILPVVDRVKIAFFEEDPKEPSLLIDVNLPIDWSAYLLSNNLLAASKPLATRYLDPDADSSQENETNSLLGNDSEVGNLTIAGN